MDDAGSYPRSKQETYAQYELRLVRAAFRVIKMGCQAPTKEEAIDLLCTSPLLKAAEMFDAKDRRLLFSPAGTGGATLIGKAPLILMCEWASEATRENADFSVLFEKATTDPYYYDLLDLLADQDARRPGRPNSSLLSWWATRPRRPKVQLGKRSHLKWRDAFLVCLLADAHTLGFPISHNREPALDSSPQVTTTATQIVSELVSLRLGQRVSERLLRDVWEKNHSRISND